MPKHNSFYRSIKDGKIYGVWHREDLSLDKIILYCCVTCKSITVLLTEFKRNFIECSITI